jgi:2-(1,2-epoxy-1,2-dihydrophenyl)acetyl-CoA isomerase
MVAGLTALITAAGNDESVRAVLLTGTGDHFCSGFDILARNASAKDSSGSGSAASSPGRAASSGGCPARPTG